MTERKKVKLTKKKMYFDKRSPLINYTVEATIVYTALVALPSVAGEKDQTTTTTIATTFVVSCCRSLVVYGTLLLTRYCIVVRLD